VTRTTSENTEAVEAEACCPITLGLSCVARWAAARVPQALRATGLLALAVAAGAIFNALNPLGIPWLPSPGNRVGIPRAFEGRLPEINAAQAFKLYETEEALFVDSREAEDYQRDHVPGAVNVPMREWYEVWPAMDPKLPRDRLLVLYCYGAHCGLSTRQGKALLEEGYEHLVVLDYGWSTWTTHGHPTVLHPEGHPGGEEGH
jgi:rhodanese-related sulfurtransferase